jgi:hypothetical protein
VIPDPRSSPGDFVERRSGGPARGSSHDEPRAVGHIPCVICTRTIELADYRSARCWTDPTGITCAAHAGCLRRLGESDLGLGAT